MNPTKRRVVIPVTRKRVSTVPTPPLAVDVDDPKHHKRKVIVTRKRILPHATTATTATTTTKTTNDDDKSVELATNLPQIAKAKLPFSKPIEDHLSSDIPSQSSPIISEQSIPHPSSTVFTTTETYLDTTTRLATKQRTYTFVVTRVHDGHSETMSSTSVRDHLTTVTDTLTKTSIMTLTVPFVPMTMTATPTTTTIMMTQTPPRPN